MPIIARQLPHAHRFLSSYKELGARGFALHGLESAFLQNSARGRIVGEIIPENERRRRLSE